MKRGLFQGKSERETFLFAASILSPEGWGWGIGGWGGNHVGPYEPIRYCYLFAMVLWVSWT